MRALTLTVALSAAGLSACAARTTAPLAPGAGPPATVMSSADALRADIDRIFDDPALAHALVGVRVESLEDGRLIYARHSDTRVIPASSLKIVTAAVAADRRGWDHRFETRLEAVGRVDGGVLHGDLIAVGGGDPTIAAPDLIAAPLFDEWALALQRTGITRIDGRLIGDDNAFDDEPLGAGWAWDYLTAGYAAPSGALSYNDNVAVVHATAGAAAGAPARVHILPAGHGLQVENHVVTAAADAPVALTLERLPGSATLTIRGQVPAGGPVERRVTTVANPTMFFVDGLRAALAARGILVRDGTWDIDDVVPETIEGERRTIATHASPPLSSIVGQMMKVSQNYYGEMLIKAVGRTADATGSTERGHTVVRETLDRWQVPADSLVMYDGSGLSRYNYATADLLAAVLRHVWESPTLRGPFVAALPVAGHDGTLGARMTDTLRRRVQAKTGTIANVRALAGFAETSAGEKLVFVMIANHYTAPNTQVDAVMERALERLIQ